MAKKSFESPFVILAGPLNPDPDDPITGGGSGQSTPDIIPCAYSVWLVIYEDYPSILDANGDGSVGTTADYIKWMTDNGFEDYIDTEG